MTGVLDGIASSLAEQGTQSTLPPLHLWHPPLSGDIDIVIRANGEWWHEGSVIKRQPLVKLFASILRREDDGEYYLVTPVEKWRIRVEDQPLLIIDFELEHAMTDLQRVFVTTNVGRSYMLGERYPLLTSATAPQSAQKGLHVVGAEDIPLVALDNNLCARFDRPAYYRLVDIGEFNGNVLEVLSDGHRFVIGSL